MLTIILICVIAGAFVASKKENGSIFDETFNALGAVFGVIGCLGLIFVLFVFLLIALLV